MLTPETRASTVSRFAPVGDVQDADSVVVRELFQRDALCGSAQYSGVSTARSSQGERLCSGVAILSGTLWDALACMHESWSLLH